MLRQSVRAGDAAAPRDQLAGRVPSVGATVSNKLREYLAGGVARGRRDRRSRHASVRRRTRRKFGVADAQRDVLGRKPQLFGDHLREHGRDAGADVLHARQNLDRSVAQDAHLAGGVQLHVRAPVRLRHADPALHRRLRSAPGACRCDQPIRCGADAPLLAPHGLAIDPVAQGERIHAELLGQLVDHLLEREGARNVAGRAHRAIPGRR